MKRLSIFYSFPHRLDGAGIGNTALHQILGLINEGCKVTVICTSYAVQLEKANRKYDSITIFGRRVPHRILGIDCAYRFHDLRASNILKKIRNDIDLVHCWPSGSLKTLQTATKLKIPTFLERPNTHTAFAYDIVGSEYKKLGLKIPLSNSHSYNSNRLLREEIEFRSANWLLVPSDFVMTTFLERGFPLNKLMRHRYGYDPERYYPSVDELQNNINGVLTVAFIGKCDPRKGLHYALQAWYESGLAERGRFLICGDFESEYKKYLSKWLDHPSINLFGFQNDVRKILNQSHILILPSIEEGSALVTYEARACGCVLLVSNRSGAVCKHMEDGLIHDCGDIKTIIEHLLIVEKNRDFLKLLRSHSIEGLSQITWDSAAKTLINIYRDCIRSFQSN